MTQQTTEFPWDGLSRPSASNEFIARLVGNAENPSHRKVYWAKSWSGKPALLVEYYSDPWKPAELPSFKNINVMDYRDERSMAIELLDLDMQDIFYRVCIDIVSALQEVDEKECRQACILRLERWSAFLKPSRSKLSPESQKGLITELHFLNRVALDALDERDAIKGWTGPDSGTRDFSYGQVLIEAKSKRNSANHYIIVSSEEQLNTNPDEQLYLYVSEINGTDSTDDEGFNVTDAVQEIKKSIGSPLVRAIFDNKLAEVGYFEEDDYSSSKWSEGESYYYAVVDGFPRIDSKACMPGVSNVKYQIDLDFCNDYVVTQQDVIAAME